MTNYSPILRSRAAELRGLKELTDQTKGKILPIIELTRSRRTSKNPGGDIVKSVEAVCEILGEKRFIADLTSLESQQNAEFDQLLSDDSGFAAWTNFALKSLPEQCIPVVHLLEPFELAPFQSQVAELKKKFSVLAIRVPTNYADYGALISALQLVFSDLSQICLILDAGYVSQKAVGGAHARLSEMLFAVNGVKFYSKAIAASSFPNSVVSAGGGDDQGEFDLTEVLIWDDLRKKYADLSYGDYAGVHPMDFTGTVTNWVPRVDVMLDTKFYYHRYRRSDGGYIKSAQEAYKDSRYVPLGCWAEENIKLAAAGTPAGRSPSFWISNRVNFHLSRQTLRVVG
ncbi:beta family protein [Xanthomonas euvesicatoria]|uniref:beta family protein n=1 Tax=Xanthomonas euvesicatoria TaxID=456327 RepID=UPI0009DE3C52|nr:beta family protein [Xanthomonas euvesicatoria]QTK49015.1 beta family protein [Xanthomonas euvesicatoria pv. alfalfae]